MLSVKSLNLQVAMGTVDIIVGWAGSRHEAKECMFKMDRQRKCGCGYCKVGGRNGRGRIMSLVKTKKKRGYCYGGRSSEVNVTKWAGKGVTVESAGQRKRLVWLLQGSVKGGEHDHVNLGRRYRNKTKVEVRRCGQGCMNIRITVNETG